MSRWIRYSASDCSGVASAMSGIGQDFFVQYWNDHSSVGLNAVLFMLQEALKINRNTAAAA
jgi:hypothetical protein